MCLLKPQMSPQSVACCLWWWSFIHIAFSRFYFICTCRPVYVPLALSFESLPNTTPTLAGNGLHLQHFLSYIFVQNPVLTKGKNFLPVSGGRNFFRGPFIVVIPSLPNDKVKLMAEHTPLCSTIFAGFSSANILFLQCLETLFVLYFFPKKAAMLV